MHPKLTPQPLKIYTQQAITRPLDPERTRLAYVRCARTAPPVADITESTAGWTFRTFPTGHWPMITAPDPTANLIVETRDPVIHVAIVRAVAPGASRATLVWLATSSRCATRPAWPDLWSTRQSLVRVGRPVRCGRRSQGCSCGCRQPASRKVRRVTHALGSGCSAGFVSYHSIRLRQTSPLSDGCLSKWRPCSSAHCSRPRVAS